MNIPNVNLQSLRLKFVSKKLLTCMLGIALCASPVPTPAMTEWDKSGTNLASTENKKTQVLPESAFAIDMNSATEKGGFEPPVQVNPVQQFSKLSP